MTEQDLRQIRGRHHLIRFFDGYAAERMEEIDERKLKRPLVKSHLLELLDRDRCGGHESLEAIFSRRQVNLTPLEDDLFLATDPQMGDIGFLERLRPRVVALYSTFKSEELIPWIHRLVMHSPEIDHVWLSGQTFSVLWDLVARLSRPQRFTKLVFTHESIFDIDDSSVSTAEENEMDFSRVSEDEDIEEIVERRATRFQLVDRIGVIVQKLQKLQDVYSPLYAISQLRFPSPVGRGGHDFYDNGRVTNRSESFLDHRNHLLFVVRIYEQLLKSTEDSAWYSIRESIGTPGQFRKIVGAPLVVKFREPLSAGVFDSLIQTTFQRKRNRLRLWGHPIRLGPTKVHVYGVDRHLWQPLFLEFTDKGCVAIVPDGTCGNTVHRLVTNIQRFLDPGAQAFVGGKPYRQMVEESARKVSYEPRIQ